MKIEILGPGCPKCQQLASNVENAVQDLALEAEIVKVTDINQISNYGVMMTPGLVVNGEVKSTGKVLTREEIKKLLTEEL